MLATLQFLIKYILILGMKLGVVFMMACTALVIFSFVCGDIKINVVKKTKEEDK